VKTSNSVELAPQHSRRSS